MENTAGKKFGFLVLVWALVIASFAIVSAENIAVTEGHPGFLMHKGRTIVGEWPFLIDENMSTYVGTGYGSADGYTSDLDAFVKFNDAVNVSEIMYKRYLRNGGSENGRVCYEKVYVEFEDGSSEEVYVKKWNGKSFVDEDTIVIEGYWENVVRVYVDLYASVGGHTSGNELRIYEIMVEGVDRDGDGYRDAVDCDDNDSGVWTEIFGVYVDSDLDLFGVGDAVSVCSDGNLPSGYSEVVGDCDDSLGSVNPDAVEICNGIDDNCDGEIDEGCVGEVNDTTAPGVVENLRKVSRSYKWISWNWTAPADADLAGYMIYIDDDFEANVTENYYKATGLDDDESYEITVYAFDTSGNVGEGVALNTKTKDKSDDDDDDDEDEEYYYSSSNTIDYSKMTIDASSGVVDLGGSMSVSESSFNWAPILIGLLIVLILALGVWVFLLF